MGVAVVVVVVVVEEEVVAADAEVGTGTTTGTFLLLVLLFANQLKCPANPPAGRNHLGNCSQSRSCLDFPPPCALTISFLVRRRKFFNALTRVSSLVNNCSLYGILQCGVTASFAVFWEGSIF